MKLIQMLKCFLTVILFIFLVKDVKSLCHSSCSTCATDNDPTQCTLCQSSYLAYQATSDTEFQCLPDPLWPENKNIEKLQYINSNTQLGLQYLKSITLNETTILVSNNLLWNGFCDSNSQCHFQTLTVSAVQFSFDGLGQDHYGVYFRLNAYHQCGASAPLLITVDSTQTNSENIASNTPAIIQTPIVTHTGVSVTLKIQYSVVGCTTGYIQDISVYLLKCDQQCIGCVNAANQCYDCKLGYKHDPVAPTCTLYALCHSTCLTCSQPLNQNKCLTCPTISSITYYSLSSTPGQCLINNDNSNNNWQQVININKNTLIGGQSLLKKVIINSTSIFTSMGTLLSSILYHQNVIDFNSLSSNILTFYFTNLGIDHHQILIRVNLFTQCNGNKNVKFSIDTLAQQTYIISSTLKQEIFQSKLANHVKSTLTLKIQYGDLNEQCAKVLQDLTIYLKKCQDYCTSCPDGGKILQFGSSICLADCPIGFYISSDGTQCMKCNSPCMDCQGTPNNCTLCGVINNTKYYLNDTNLNDVNTGGVCVPDCTGAFYQGIDNNTCLPCHEGCDACQMSPTNCSKCKTTQSSVYYFLQPDIKACLTTCPQKYFKFSDHTCKKCASGFGDWDQVNLQVSCSQSCHGNCLSCFGSAQTECFTCSSSYYLQPLSTTCLGTCPAGYSPSATGNICQATRYCHSSCSACNFKGNKNSCTSCSFALLPSLTFENIISQGSCSPVIDDTNNPNIRFFTSIDKNSIIGQGNLQSIIFNGASRSVVGTKLSDLLFTTGDMLNFDTLTSNEVNFNLNNLGFNHHKVFVRFNAYASCSSLNQTLILTVGGKVKNLGSVTSQQVYESDFIAHISNSLTIQLSFGTVNQGCPKLIQDISVYIQQCASYCLTCPDGGSYLQYGSTQCLSSCPEGFYLNENSTQCLKCSSQCLDCQGGPTNCTKCGVINGKIYFLNDTDLNQILTGGVCVQDCTGSYFQNLADYSCKKCGTGCKECQGSANNCSSCWLEGTVEYFLQPGQLKCQSTCPSEYFKFSDNTCKKCTNSKYGNWNFLYGLSLVEACSIDCPSECFQCFGALTHECTSCASGYFLQQGTTTCSGTCPAGYMTNSIKNTCQPTRFCHSSCKVGACSNLGDISSCTACQSLLLTDLTYESFLVRGPCTPDTTNPALSNIQLFTTISKTSIIGASNLKSLTVPSLQKYSTLNTSISTLIYNDLQLINFDLFTTSTTISFQLANLGFNHHHVYVRINAYSSCLDSDGNDLEIIIDGKSASVNDITPTNKIVQTPFILHTGNSLTLTIKFGLPNKSCSKLVQDISIYLQKCQSYCATCPDGGKLLQYGLTSCLSSCPVGYYPSQTMKSCDKCDINCTTCTSTSIECTSCGFISGRYYFLQSSTKKCVSQCPPGQFQNYVSFTCDPCADGCVSCDINATNCFSCTQKQGKVYYKQPGQNKCVQDSCPAKYSKTIDFTCIKCTNGKFGDGVGGSTEQCTTLCEDGCETCFDAGLTNCLTCTARSTDPQQHYYLQPDQYSTQCSLTCPSGYYGNQSTHRCDKCSSLCKTCQMSLTQCTSCNYVNGVMLLLSTTGNKCISACYIGEYADLVNKKCLTCADGCAQCYGPGLDKCTKCTTDTNGDSLYKHPLYDQCLTQCPIGQYEYALTNQCLYCHRSCLQCQSNATDCIKCANETGIIYFLYSPNGQNTCVVNCPLGYYTSKSTNQCVKCDQRCVQCYGPGNGSCTKCKPDSNSIDHFLVYGTTICSDLCQDGTYYNYSSFKCQQCGINCITCVDLPTKCMSCGWTNYGVRLFLDNYKCVQFCTPGYYQQTNNNTCNQCQSGCKTCNMSGLNNCQSCKDVVTTVIDPDTQVGSTVVTKYYKHIGIDTCDTSCPTGQFIDSAVSFFCQPCSPECKACQNTAKTCLDASSCNAGYFFFSSNNSCLAVCPDGFYANTSTITCTPCHPGCALCKGGSLTQCTACKIDDVTDPSTPVTYFKKISLSQCSTVCDAGQYEDPTDFLCKYCHNTCSECLDASENCTSCKNVSGIVYFLYNPNDENQCVQVCPDGFYGQKSTNKCMPCDERCKLCTGPSNDSCSECQSAMVNSVSVSHYLVYNTKVCSDTCPDGQYADATTNKCLLCDTNCKTCETSSTNCLSCNLTQYGKKVFLQNTICVQTCKPGFYGEIDTNICTSCHPGCLTCTQSALTDCQSCTNITINSVTTIYYKHLNSNTCSLTCPDGQFIDINKPNICQLCSPQCLYCVDNGKRCTNSSSCSVGFYFYSVNNSCLGTCPNGFYGDQISKICVKCGIGCAICTGPGLTSCTVCQIDTLSSTAYYKYKDFTICNTTCPEGFYPKLLTLTCQPCHSSCALCTTGPEDCQSCKNSTGIIYFNYGNKCVQKCPDSFYGDPPTNLCKDCHQGCALCATANNNSCSACRNVTATNLVYFLQYGTTYCSLSCPNGQYKIPSLNICGKCNDNCNTCDGTATNCTSCYLTPTGIKLFLSGNICVQQCPSGQYANQISHLCEDCHQGCATCFGPILQQCYTCKKSNDGLINYYKYINQTICGQQLCPLGQYININFTSQCQTCDPSCKACIDKATNCLSTQNCSDNYFFYAQKNSCLLACPGGYYAQLYTNKNYGACNLCQPGCALCTGPGLMMCQKCTTYNGVKYYKEILTQECTINCIAGQYEVDTDLTCKTCHPSCVICNSSATDCQQCRSVSGQGYFYFSNQCLIKCPDGYWGNIVTNQCELCHDACQTCFGTTIQQCYSCRPILQQNYYLIVGTTECALECPYGQYEVNSTKTCRQCSTNCASCDILSTNCTSCSYLATTQILFWYNYKCVIVCPVGYWQNTTIENDHQCTLCHPYCSKCTGPSAQQCQSCKNVSLTDPLTRVTSVTNYYKDLESNTCSSTCPDGQFISSFIPNSCVYCSTACQLCSITKTNCTKCTSSFYLYQQAFSCLAQCPAGYFNDNTLTAMNYKCTKCTPGCSLCTGSGLDNCQSCTNVTTNNNNLLNIVSYFKHPTLPKCIPSCPVGYYGQLTTNKCQKCQQGCVACQGNASYCSSCTTYQKTAYYFNLNSCVSICPNGTYGDPITFTCLPCIYFSYEGNCLLTCPNSTFVNVTNNKTICQNCSVELNTCDKQYAFGISTKLVNEGKSMQHKVTLPQGLYSSITPQQLQDGLRVFLVIDQQSRRRLQQQSHRRLLQQLTLQLSVENLKISPDRNYIFIQTSTTAESIDFTKAKVQANFKGGVLISRDGTGYMSTTTEFTLNDPGFMESYYKVFLLKNQYLAEGIVLTGIGFILMLITLGILSRRAYHQVMAFMMFIQCIGFLRLHSYPLDVNIYTILSGFTYLQFMFVPNGIVKLYPIGYEQVSLPAIKFAIGDHNFFTNMGGALQIFLGLQLILFIYFIWNKDNQQRVTRYKFWQQALITFFFIKTIFSSFLALYSFALNPLNSMPIQFLVSQVIAIAFLLAYLIYLLVFVRRHRAVEFYKVHNLLRMGCLLLVIVNRLAGMITLNILQVIVFGIDFWLYRNQKVNKWLYVIDRLLCLVAFNCAAFMETPLSLLIALGVSLYVVLSTKIYMVIKAIMRYRQQKQEQQKQLSNLSLSDAVINIQEQSQSRKSYIQKLSNIQQSPDKKIQDKQALARTRKKRSKQMLNNNSSQSIIKLNTQQQNNKTNYYNNSINNNKESMNNIINRNDSSNIIFHFDQDDNVSNNDDKQQQQNRQNYVSNDLMNKSKSHNKKEQQQQRSLQQQWNQQNNSIAYLNSTNRQLKDSYTKRKTKKDYHFAGEQQYSINKQQQQQQKQQQQSQQIKDDDNISDVQEIFHSKNNNNLNNTNNNNLNYTNTNRIKLPHDQLVIYLDPEQYDKEIMLDNSNNNTNYNSINTNSIDTSGFKTDIAFYPIKNNNNNNNGNKNNNNNNNNNYEKRRQKNRTKLQVNNKSTNLIDDVEVIQIEHHSDNDNNYENQSSISELSSNHGNSVERWMFKKDDNQRQTVNKNIKNNKNDDKKQQKETQLIWKVLENQDNNLSKEHNNGDNYNKADEDLNIVEY